GDRRAQAGPRRAARRRPHGRASPGRRAGCPTGPAGERGADVPRTCAVRVPRSRRGRAHPLPGARRAPATGGARRRDPGAGRAAAAAGARTATVLIRRGAVVHGGAGAGAPAVTDVFASLIGQEAAVATLRRAAAAAADIV